MTASKAMGAPLRSRHPTLAAALAAAGSITDKGFTFVAEDNSEHHVSYAQFAERAASVAAHMRERGYEPGDRVVLIIPDNETFMDLFFGLVWAGMVPVPIYPPMGLGRLQGYLEQAAHIVEAADAAAVVTTEQVRPVLGRLMSRCRGLREVMCASDLRTDTAGLPVHEAQPADLCFIQFTSGSTSRPKGVQITHGNLVANVTCIAEVGIQVTENDCGVSWLPLYHDMGLIGCVLTPLFYGVPMVSLAPLTFLKRPHRWLEAISRHRGTVSFAPNFAYGLCSRRIKPRHLEGLDLSCWRVAGCGAEPIQLETLHDFADHFRGAGFDAHAIYPTYGLAEATLAVSFGALGRGLVVDRVDARALNRHHRAEPVADGASGGLEIVGCGSAFPDHELAIVGPDGARLEDREVGEVLVRGPSVTPGYFRDARATAKALANGWLSTGDLGYMVDGELFVCGRKKELIIVSGKNYYPQDLERSLWDLPDVRTGNVIAFGVPSSAGEELVVALETRAPGGDREALGLKVRRRLQETVGLQPQDVIILSPGSLPKTSSGKLQRTKTAALFLDGALEDAPERPSRLGIAREVASSQLGYMRSYLARQMGLR